MIGSRRRRLGRAALAGLTLLLVVPAVALAHPLGNFTINHYAGLRVTPTEIRLDVVLDRAEIPTFQERLRLDVDGDGLVSEAEATAAREPACRTLAASLELAIDGARVPLDLTATGLSFPPGAGGLSTMRLVCELVAPFEGGVGAGRTVRFTDHSYPDRLGWREIVVAGDGTTVTTDGQLPGPVSDRLTAYPADRLQSPLAMKEIEFTVKPGGTTLPPFSAPDAQPVDGTPPTEMAPAAAVVAGGVGADIPEVFRTTDVSPAVLLLALGTALALGAGHALTPGHGKTLMAAYLVGTRGTAIHAVGLGLSVTVSHTIGILVLAALVVGAQGVLPADLVVRWLPLVAALTIVAIGGWMVAGELRRRRASQLTTESGHSHDGDHPHAHDHPHDANGHEPGGGHEDGHAGVHTHGGVRHTHVPADTTITWRSLFALGLAGGIIPSTSALLILLGTIATGRAAFGIVLVIAFGIGMAGVLGGVGLVLVKARSALDRVPASSSLAQVTAVAPLVAAIVVFGLGVWLTSQAIGGGAVP